MVFIKESDLSGLSGILTEEFDGLAPVGLLAALSSPR